MTIGVFIICYIRRMRKIALIMGGWVYRGGDFIQGGGWQVLPIIYCLSSDT